MEGLFAGIYFAESLESAIARRDSLAAHESIVTEDGVWIGHGWVRVIRNADSKAGVLKREQELSQLEVDLSENIRAVVLIEAAVEESRSALKQAEVRREEIQAEANQAHRLVSEARAQLDGRKNRLEHAQNRATALQKEGEEIRSQMQQDEQAMEAARKVLHEALASLESMESERERLMGEKEALKTALDEARSTAQSDRDRVHELTLKVSTWRTEKETTQQNLERMQSQQSHLEQRRSELQTALQNSEAPVQQQASELAEKLQKHNSVESRLKEERAKVETVEHTLREQEQQRQQKEQRTQALRETVSQGQLRWQEIKVRAETLLESLQQSDFELTELVEEIDADATIEVWSQRIEQLEQKINRLGPINLAAIEEYESESERKEYLDAQHADVTAALETLEEAIRKIDRETRTRFKETYDKVNQGFQEGFPRLFGGGHAYLELTGDDLLDTGVTVMARPPGKRNSTIHLLSGGEKALTAVALVFSIFQLNPSPFCMLDEVDAPLDDANVGRFCKMVSEMSDKVQFIFITHNKITMELARQLTGVTMHEPGVSRLVAVDVEEAAQMAAM